MAKIYAPNKQYTGISAGVSFINGVGETTDPHLIDWFKSKGYEVEKQSNKPNNTDQNNGSGNNQNNGANDENKNTGSGDDNSNNEPQNSKFDDMSVDELREYAEKNGIDIGKSTSRTGILGKIVAAEAEKQSIKSDDENQNNGADGNNGTEDNNQNSGANDENKNTGAADDNLNKNPE